MMASKRESRSGSGAAVFVSFLLIVVIVKFIWWILGAAALVGVFFVGRAVVRARRKRAEEYSRYCGAIAARADQQHNWVLQGDDRGIYGPQGAELMHYLYPATNRRAVA